MRKRSTLIFVKGCLRLLTLGSLGALAPAAAAGDLGPVLNDPTLTIKKLNGYLHSIAFSPEGKTLATGTSDGLVRLWDAASGEELRSLRGHQGNVGSVAFTPDGKTLASGSWDQTVRIWSPVTGEPGVVLEGQQPQPVSTSSGMLVVAFAPDGKTLASTDNGINFELMRTKGCVVHLWDAATGKKRGSLQGHTGSIYCLAWSPDGRRLATGSCDRTVRTWEAATGKEVLRLAGQVGAVDSIAYAPDGKALAFACRDVTVAEGKAEVKLWDLVQERARVAQPGYGPVAFSPDGKWLACLAKDRGVHLLSVRTGEETVRLNTRGVACLAFSPDGKRLAVGSDRWMQVSVWDLRPGRTP
jgi:WD40 repeat protein